MYTLLTASQNIVAFLYLLYLWLAWLGQTMPALEDLWHKYLRRFTLEHWYRFAKQRLYWTQPQLGSTQAAERWSHLMPLLTWQLWLAGVACIDSPLPSPKAIHYPHLSQHLYNLLKICQKH